MGFFSISISLILGYYFRGTTFGSNLGRKLSAIQQLIKNGGERNYKLVLVVRDDLNMGKGKIASQCSHASILAYQHIVVSDPVAVDLWSLNGQGKIVVKIDSEEKLHEISRSAKKLGLPVHIVSDAGLTQIARGSKTVAAIGPGLADTLDKATGHLKLL